MIGLLSNRTKADVSPEGLLPHESAKQTRTRVHTRPVASPSVPPARPEQAVEERLVDQVREEASGDQPARGDAVAQARDQAGPDPDMSEDEQRLEVEARRDDADGRGLVGLLRLRDSDQRLELQRPRRHP